MWDLAYIAKQQRADADIGPAMSWIDNGERPKWVSVKGASPALRALYQQYESLLMIDCVLYRSYYDVNGSIHNNQLVLPISLRRWSTVPSHDMEGSILMSAPYTYGEIRHELYRPHKMW